MSEFPPALPHESIHEVFPDVFFVTGTFKMGPGVTITRNMTILRDGKDLSVVNSVRLSSDGEAALEELGSVKNVVRIGAFHGADDAYFVKRFGAKLHAPPRTRHAHGVETDRELEAGPCELRDVEVFAFEQAKKPEVALLLARDGGILIPCDSYQNWTTTAGCSLGAKAVMKLMGFGPAVIGGPWTKAQGSGVRADFERLAERDFRHLVPAHGTVLKNDAKDALRRAIAARFA